MEKQQGGEVDLHILLRSLQPVIVPGEYVFVTVDATDTRVDCTRALAMVRESLETLSLVLPRALADELKLNYSFVACWITLQVHSSLEAIGLTAAVAAALTHEGISCNVIAGHLHDHLLVPTDRISDAERALQRLSASAARDQQAVASPSQPHQQLDVISDERVIIVGDVHGCFDELQALLHKLDWVEGKDVLISVGDLVNKGPKSVETVAFFMNARRTFAVRGNHDEAALRALAKPAAKRKEGERWVAGLGADHEAFLRELPYTLALPALGVVVVHAGLETGQPSKRLQDMSAELLVTMRVIEGQGEGQGQEEGEGQGKRGKSKGKPWASVYGGEHGFAVFGHDAKRGLQREEHALGLDTGCVYGRSLTAVVLPGRELVSVPAARVYSVPG